MPKSSPVRQADLTAILRWRAATQGNTEAYTYLQDGEAAEVNLTYAELDQAARAIAGTLQQLGAKGERVLLLFPPGLAYITAFYGCLYAGAVAVPAYPPRQNRSLLRLQSIVADAQASFVLTSAAILARVEEWLPQNPDLAKLQWLSTDTIDSAAAAFWSEPDIRPETLAFLQYTSGSTALPKGVMVSHGNLMHNQEVIRTACAHTEQSTFVGWLPLYHDMGLIGNVMQPLYLGSRCVLLSPVAFLQRPLRWLQAISRYRGQTSGGPNFAYELCVRKIAPEERARLDLSSWRIAFNGAEPVRQETLARFAAAFADCGFRRESFYPCYGLAEATLFVAGGAPGRSLSAVRVAREALAKGRLSAALEEGQSLVSCGQPQLEQQIVIVNPDSRQRCAPGEIGEIWLSGGSVAAGYWNRPAETEAVFRARIAGTDEGPFLRTGDLGAWYGGELFVTGRLKDLIIIRGRNHYPQDIEFTVERSDAALRPGCVAAFTRETEAGEEQLVIVQEVENRNRQRGAELIEKIRAAVAEEHELLPVGVALIKPGSIPKTSSGKIQRRACRAAYLQGELEIVAQWQAATLPAATEDGEQSTARPGSVEELEGWLLDLTARRMNLSRAELDAQLPLARHGLDSLGAVELAHVIETELGLSLSSFEPLQSLTLAQLAAQLFSHLTDERRPVAAAPKTASGEKLPLSQGQRALYYLHQVSPESSAYNIANAVRIRSGVNVAALRRALQSLVERHSILRATFGENSGEPWQQIAESTEIQFTNVAIGNWAEEQLTAAMDAEANRPIDLSCGPLLRVTLFTRETEDHVLLLVVHHIAADLWSLGLWLREMGLLYAAENAGQATDLPSVTLAYQDFVSWQQQMLAGPEGTRLEHYWAAQLRDGTPPLELWASRAQVDEAAARAGTQAFTLSAELTQRLKALGQQQNATLFVTLLAAFQTLLHRFTGQEEFLLGAPVMGRRRVEWAGMLGYLVNPVVLRADLTGNPRFVDLLARAEKTAREAFAHQDYPFALLAERMKLRGESASASLLQVMFVMQQAAAEGDATLAAFALGAAGAEMELGGLRLEAMATPATAAQFPLTLTVAEHQRGIVARWSYDRSLLDAEMVEALAAGFEVLLAAIAREPQTRISEFPLLSAQAQKRLLAEWRGPSVTLSGECLHDRFVAQAERAPDAIAVVSQENGVRAEISYGELNRRANQLAHHLRGMGVGPETRVGVLLERSADLPMALLAVLKAGAAYVPLDPAYPTERLAFMLSDAAVAALVTTQSLLGQTGATAPAIICLDAAQVVIAREPDCNPPSATTPENLAYVIYTSGSTGQPKGALITHANVARLLSAAQPHFQFQADDVWTLFHSAAFDFSVWEMWGALLYGGRLVIVPYLVSRTPEAFWALLQREGVTVLNQTPSAFRQLISAEAASGDVAPLSLRWVILGGEALSFSDLQPWFRRRGDQRPQLVNMYGITETTVHVTHRPLTESDFRLGGSLIGRPLSAWQLYVLDEQLRPVPQGVAGELYVGGAGVARGYWARPELTAERFLPDPFSGQPGARLYRTGDRARYLSRGEFEYLGRTDQQLKIRGFRIEPGEIEAALQEHPAIREAVVRLKHDLRTEARLIAYVVRHPGAAMVPGELRAHLRAKLPVHMVPAAFVELHKLPLTAHGKLNWQALPVPEPTRPELETRYEPPRSEAEATLAEVWAQALGLECVGVHDNFFDLGGDSIRSLRVKALAQERGLGFTLAQLFEHPTVQALAQVATSDAVAQLQADAQPVAAFALISAAERAALPAELADAYPLTQLQMGLVFHSEHSADYETYVTSLHLRSPFDATALRDAVSRLQARHAILRTSFNLSHFSTPLQLVHKTAPLPLGIEDWRQRSSAEQQTQLAALIAAERRRRFDWGTPPLFALRVLRRSDDSFQLILSEPLLDGWSVASLLTELFTIYFALLERGDYAAAPLQATFRDYVAAERKALQSGASGAYWNRLLAGVTASKLPRWPQAQIATRAAGDASSAANEVRRLDVPISPALSAALRRTAREAGAPLKSLLLAAHLKVIGFINGQDDVVTGVLYNGRPEMRDGERVLGLFLNALPFRLPLGTDSWAELARRAFRVERESMPHRWYPLAEIQRRSGGQPLFDTAFNFTHFHVYQHLHGLGGMAVLDGYASDQTFFDLTAQFNVDHASPRIRLALDYRAANLGDEQMQAIAGYYQNALVALTTAPQTSHTAQTLLSETERLRAVHDWNRTAVVLADDQLLPDWFEAQAAQRPEAIALRCGDRQLTYGELNERANQLAHYLQAAGVGAESVTGICLERTPEMLVGLLAILKAGGAYLPLDPEYPAERLAFMLHDAAPSVLLTQSHLAARLSGQTVRIISLDEEQSLIARSSRQNPARGQYAENLAYLIYTSGSTGRAKGVRVAHRALANFLTAMRATLGISAQDKLLAVTTLSFDIAALELFLPLTVGACVELVRRETAMDGAALLTVLAAAAPTLMQATPATWRLLLAAGWRGDHRLKVLCGGEALPRDLAAQLIPRGQALWNLYGPTETTIWSAAAVIESGATPITIGQPIANTQLYLLDAHLQLVPPGAPAELYIGGDGLADGYHQRPALTAEKFIPDPFASLASSSAGRRLYKTGDLACYWPDGRIEVLGRLDQQVKVRGHRIELGEIEAVLGQHPAIRQAAVIAHEASPGHKYLFAYVVLHDGHELAGDELRQFLGAKLPSFMVPSGFAALSALPLTPNGKLDRRQLPPPSLAKQRSAASPEELQALLKRLAALSEAEAQALLEQKRMTATT